jgi:hypothetical protein
LDYLGFRLVGHKAPVLDVVAQRGNPSHPHALSLAGSDLVADALAGDLAFELGK